MEPDPAPVPQRAVPEYDPPNLPLTVVFGDESLIVLDKPTGLLTVRGKNPGTQDCLESRAQAQYQSARIVHRLDWDTSGLIILALTADAQRKLGRQFEDRTVDKHYIARVWGKVQADEGEIDLPLRCDWPNRPRQIVDNIQGKPAFTRWQVLCRTMNTTDLLLKPRTGRSHQLRVHCQQMGHPIVGDRLYAHEDAYRAHARMCLHSHAISFDHPVTGERIHLQSECPF